MNSTTTTILFLSTTMFACGSPGAPPNDDDVQIAEDALLDGTLDGSHRWAVGICTSAPNTNPAAGPKGACVVDKTRCNGALIAPNLVLTAAECVSKVKVTGDGFCDGNFTGQALDPAGARVTTASSVMQDQPPWTPVKEMFLATGDLCSGNLALLVLAERVKAKDARPVAVDLRDLELHRPAEVTVFGRGRVKETLDPETGEAVTSDDGEYLRRFLEHIPFACIGNGTSACQVVDAGGDMYPIPKGQFEIGPALAGHDLGSAVLPQGKATIIGVAASATTDPATKSTSGGQIVRVDMHATLIRNTAKHAARLGGYPLPDWAK